MLKNVLKHHFPGRHQPGSHMAHRSSHVTYSAAHVTYFNPRILLPNSHVTPASPPITYSSLHGLHPGDYVSHVTLREAPKPLRDIPKFSRDTNQSVCDTFQYSGTHCKTSDGHVEHIYEVKENSIFFKKMIFFIQS